MSDEEATSSEPRDVEASPYFEVDLPGGGRLRFASHEDLLGWLRADLKALGWIKNPSKEIYRGDPSLLSVGHEALRELQSSHGENHLQAFREALEASRYVPADSPRGRYAASLSQRFGTRLATFTYASWLRPGDNIPLKQHHYGSNLPLAAALGSAHAVLFDAGVPDPSLLRASYGKLLQDFDQDLELSKDKAAKVIEENDEWLTDEGNALIERHEKLATDHETKLNELQARDGQRERTWAAEVESLQTKVRALEELLAAQKAEHEGVAATGREELEKIEKLRETLHKRIVTEAPVKNWTERAATAGKAAKAARNGAAISGGAFLLFLFLVGGYFLFGLDSLAPHKAGAALVIAVALAWPVRFFLKLYLSSRHMQTEASERVAMTKTFIALTDNESMKPDQHLLVLQALFRPTNTGLIGGDAMPPGVYDLLSKWLAKGSGAS